MTEPTPLRAPFPWFGGKSRVAHLVWERFGDTPNYVEPFAGSLAVLLARPHEPRTETVNDRDGFLANFWRAVQHAPEQTARFADWPVNEADLHARHRWLLAQRSGLYEAILSDPDWFDAKIAGWWVWGLCAWIGSGWCTGGAATQLPHLSSAGMGLHRKIPHLGTAGCGEHRSQHMPHRKLPALGDAGRGDLRPAPSQQIPHLGNAGRGGHRVPTEQLPALGDGGRGVPVNAAPLVELFQTLSARLRRVRVACGDWTRVMGESVTVKHGLTGVFLDPPYSDGEHAIEYAGGGDVAADVREWAVANGDNPLMRIALCGYEGEHAMPDEWECVPWKSKGGYGSQGDGRGRENAERERIWFSPHCLKPERVQRSLFDDLHVA